MAATWAAMIHHGEEGYVSTTRQIVTATREIAAAIAEMDDLVVVGRPDACVVAFAGTAGSGINCYALCDAMKDLRSWDLATLQSPPSIHLALTLPTSRNAHAFVSDLKIALQMLRDHPEKYSGGTAGLYGTASKVARPASHASPRPPTAASQPSGLAASASPSDRASLCRAGAGLIRRGVGQGVPRHDDQMRRVRLRARGS